MKIETLRAAFEALQTEVAELDALENPTEEQTARFALAIDEAAAAKVAYDQAVERAEKIDAIKAAALAEPKTVERAFHAPNVTIKKDPFENVGDVVRMRNDDEDLIARAITAVSDTKYRGGVPDSFRQSAVESIEMIPGVAKYALAHGSPEYMNAFRSFMSSFGQRQFTPEEAAAVRTADEVARALSLTGNAGGYSLPTLLDPTLIKTGTAVKNPIRRLARVETGTQNVWHGVSVGNVTTYWKAEGSAFTDGSPTFSNPAVTAYDLTAYLVASYEIFEDSNLQVQMPGLIGEAFDYKESTAFVSGDGSTQPKGIVTAISATVASTVTVTTRGAFTSASSADLFALLNSVTPRYEDTATWVANKATFNTVRQMSSAANGSLFWTDLNSSTPPSLLGSQIAASSDMPSATTSGNVLVILGDFSQFLIYDRIGTQIEFVQNVVDGSGLPTGQRGILAHKRVGSDCTDINAFRFLKC